MRTWIESVLTYGVICSMVLSCDEQLPPTGNPENLLTATSEASYTGAPGVESPPGAENAYVIEVHVKNMYDETLQGYVVFGGSIEIVWERDPKYRKTVTFTKSMILDNRSYKYDPNSNLATMDPGGDITFYYAWNWITDSGDTLTKLFDIQLDRECANPVLNLRGKAKWYVYPRGFSKEIFIINARVKVFREFAAITTPRLRQLVEYETYPKSDCGIPVRPDG